MERSSISLLLILGVAPLLFAQKQSVREAMRLLGPVQSVRTEVEYDTGSGQQNSARVLMQLVTFDEKGNVTESAAYNRDGTQKSKTSWRHVYDDQGRKIQTAYYNAQGVLTNTGLTVYDTNGRPSQVTQINPNGTINHIRRYFYNDKGHNIRETYASPSVTEVTNVTLAYDVKGRVAEETYYDEQGAIRQKNAFKYDELGERTEWIMLNIDGTSKQMFRKVQTYDDRGNIKEIINYLSDNTVLRRENFSYEFDNRGNWTKRITSRELFKNSVRQLESEITYRTISYF